MTLRMYWNKYKLIKQLNTKHRRFTDSDDLLTIWEWCWFFLGHFVWGKKSLCFLKVDNTGSLWKKHLQGETEKKNLPLHFFFYSQQLFGNMPDKSLMTLVSATLCVNYGQWCNKGSLKDVDTSVSRRSHVESQSSHSVIRWLMVFSGGDITWRRVNQCRVFSACLHLPLTPPAVVHLLLRLYH